MKEQFDKILVQYPSGEVVDITTLPSEEYEEFLDVVMRLKMIYQMFKNNMDNYDE